MTDDPIRLATARWRGLTLIQNALNNLIHHVDDKVCWDSLGQPLDGVPAVIVAAGPSLDESIGHLRQLQGKCFLACVNTALPAMRHHGIEADLCLTLENMDMSHQLDGGYRYLACGLASHPHIFRRASIYVVDECPNWMRIAELLGTEPMPTGPSALCLGANLLRRLGAPSVTLVGADLAIYPGDALYGKHTGWGMIETEAIEGGIRCKNTDERKNLHWDNNIPAPNDERTATCKLPAIGGGEVDSLPEFKSQFDFLSRVAEQGWLDNLTMRGAHVAPRAQMPILPRPEHGKLPITFRGKAATFKAERALIDLREQSRVMAEFAEVMLARNFEPMPVPPHAPIVEGMCVPDFIAMRQELSHLSRGQRYEGTYTIVKAAAMRLGEIVG